MSFFDVHFLHRKLMEMLNEGLAIKDVLQRGNTHMIVAHHVQTKRTFYSFVRHFKKLKDVENVSLILLGEEQFHHFIECLSSIHNLLKDFYPNPESDIPDLDLNFHVELASEIQEIIFTKKRRIG